MNLNIWEGLTDKEKGVRLGMFLSEHNMEMEDYINYIGDFDLSTFQVKRFKTYVERINTLTDGWYWVSPGYDKWLVAYYDGDSFQVLNNEYTLEDLVEVDTREIVREEEDEDDL